MLYCPYILHYGIPGMRWGVRRYQNSDGTLTDEGQRKYGDQVSKITKDFYKGTFNPRENKYTRKAAEQKNKMSTKMSKRLQKNAKAYKKFQSIVDNMESTPEEVQAAKSKYVESVNKIYTPTIRDKAYTRNLIKSEMKKSGLRLDHMSVSVLTDYTVTQEREAYYRNTSMKDADAYIKAVEKKRRKEALSKI